MANFAIYRAADNLSTLKVGEAASPTSYTSIAKAQTYALDGTGTEEIKLSFSTATTLNAVAITGLDQYQTITIEKTLSAVDTTLGTIAGATYAAESRARDTFNALLIFSDQSCDDITITFGTPYPTGFRTVFAGSLSFQPTDNFNQGAAFVDSSEFSSMSTRSSNYNQIQSRLRAFNPEMVHLSDEEFHDINHTKYKVGDGVCLVVLDSAVTHPEKWMLSTISGGSSSIVGDGRNTHNIQFLEANKWA